MFFQSGSGNVTIKKCGNFFRICVFKSRVPFEGENATRKNSIPEEKNGLERKRNENIMRAKRIVWELALCNRWDYFATCTLDSKNMTGIILKSIEKILANG